MASSAAPSSVSDGTRAARLLFRVGVIATIYYLAVILWGAWVRIAGAGAGCGEHWPLCNGEVIPVGAGTKTFIEFTHRVTSGLAGPLGIALVVFAFRSTTRGHRIRVAALGQLVFLGIEALLGRLLVKKGLVVDDDSVERAVVMGLHLINTYALLGATALCAYWSRPNAPNRLPGVPVGALLWAAGIAILVMSDSGAITALGDTIFPPSERLASGIFDRFRDAFNPDQHFLMRLLILHPILSVAGSVLIVVAALRRVPRVVARPLVWLVVAQLVFGVLNVLFKAPGWAQLVHLFLAELIWVAYVLAVAARRDLGAPEAAVVQAGS